MVISQLTGGLGNQLFQYAAAKSLALHHQVLLQLDISSFYRDKIPDLEVPRSFELFSFTGVKEKIIRPDELNEIISPLKNNILSRKLTPAYKKQIYIEPHYHFDSNFFKAGKNNVLLKGGWQSEKYFKKYSNIIRDILEMKDNLVENVKGYGEILKNQNSVSVHIRRGDYLRKKIIFDWHGVMDLAYYKKAFDVIKSKMNVSKVCYFTDDTEWVRSELKPLLNGEIISGSISKSHFEDLYLMSQCRHNIIANSSFSWWGAWLNDNPDKIVIAPAKWFNKGPKDTQDLIPEGWMKI